MRRFVATLLAAGALLASAPASAEGRRTLDGHTFPRAVGDDSAFLLSTVGFRQGLLFVDAGSVTALGQTKPVAQAAAIESLDASIRVVDWLAIGAVADVQALVGASEVGLYGTPGQVAGGVRLGPSFRLFRSEKLALQGALRPYFRATTGALLDTSSLLPALRERLARDVGATATTNDAIARAQDLENDLLRAAVTPLRRRAWGGTLHLAKAFSSDVGLQLSYGLELERFLASSFDLSTDRTTEQTATALSHRVSAALSIDGARVGVPVAMIAELVLSATSVKAQNDEGPSILRGTMLVGPGLYYTGRRALQVGVHMAVESGLTRYATPYGPSEIPRAYYGQFALRYFFDE